MSATTMTALSATRTGCKGVLHDCVEIRSGKLKGIFDPSQFGPGGRSLCITMPSKAVGDVARIVSPIEFEAMSDLSQCHAWKRSLRISSLNKTLGQLIDTGELKVCDKKCSCNLCQKSNDYMNKKRRASMGSRKGDISEETTKHTISGKLQDSLFLIESVAKDEYNQRENVNSLNDFNSAYNENRENGNINIPTHSMAQTQQVVSPPRSQQPLEVVIVKEGEGNPNTRLQFPPLTSLLQYQNLSRNSDHSLSNDSSRKRDFIHSPIPTKRSRDNSGPIAQLNGHILNLGNGGYKDSDSDSGISNISNMSNRTSQGQGGFTSQGSPNLPTVRVPSFVSNSVALSMQPSNVTSCNDISSGSNIQNIPETNSLSTTPCKSQLSKGVDTSDLATSSTCDAIPDYTSMVREAIASVSMAVPNDLQGNVEQRTLPERCSRLTILLYILAKYKPAENINVIYTKVGTALALLERMGVIDKIGVCGHDNVDSDLEEEDHLRSRPEPTPSPKEVCPNPLLDNDLSGKKKVAKHVFKHSVLDEEISFDMPDPSIGPPIEHAKMNSKKHKITNNGLQTSKIPTNPSNDISIPLKKKESNKPWIGIKTSGAAKGLNKSHISSTEKILKIKMTKDGTKKSLSNSAATKENQKTKLNKGKHITKGGGPNQAKQKSPLDKTSKPTPAVRHYRLKRLSPELAAICGKKKLSRHDVVSRMWRYIKKKRLQDPNHRTTILCDEKLRALTKKPSIGQTDMLLCIGSHLTLIH